jgi:hypothetical protein
MMLDLVNLQTTFSKTKKTCSTFFGHAPARRSSCSELENPHDGLCRQERCFHISSDQNRQDRARGECRFPAEEK